MRLTLSIAALLAALGTAAAHAGTEQPIYDFTDQSDGGFPHAGVIADPATHILYGTATSGGALHNGTVFMLTPPATHGSAWTETTLYAFSGGSDGAVPYADLMRDSDGNLFGTTIQGGADGQGVVYEVSPPAPGQTTWTETVLWTFTGGVDGGQPSGKLIEDREGNLYGTATIGGTGVVGVVFELSPPAAGQTAWTETVLYNFTGNKDGGEPTGRLVAGSADTLYGTTAGYGTYNYGNVYALHRNGSTWNLRVLHSFRGGTDGEVPRDGMIMDEAGYLYGTTAGFDNSYGNVFRLAPPSITGSGWRYKVLYNFSGNGFTGNGPWATVSLDKAGNLYGTTLGDGAYAGGSVFELTPPAGGTGKWTETTLQSFTQNAGSEFPYSTVLIDGNTLFGTTYGYAGQSGFVPGNVWQIIQ